MISSKIKILINIYKFKGISEVIKAIFKKNFNLSYNYKSIAKEVTTHISASTNPEVYKRLSEGVYYVFGMGVQGDIAEFGTMSGRTAVALAASINYCNSALSNSDRLHGFKRQRKLWLFDSFEGLPVANTSIDRTCIHVTSGIWGGGVCRGLSPDALLSLTCQYLDKDKTLIYKGWFKDTVPNIPVNTRFALIHIDGDLYESAIDVLNGLLSKNMISKGAQIFFDDWNCNAADPEFGERRAWREMVEKYNIHFSDIGSYGIVGHRFIIHSYIGSHD